MLQKPPELSLQINDDDRNGFAVGDKVSGELQVNAPELVRCSNVDLTLRGYTVGRGKKEVRRERFTEVRVFRWPLKNPTLKKGEQRKQSFSATIPEVQPSFAGEMLHVEWELEAQADIPWAFDPKMAVPIEIIPAKNSVAATPRPESRGYRDLPKQEEETKHVSKQKQMNSGEIGMVFICLIISLLGLAMLDRGAVGREWIFAVGGVVAGLCVVLGVLYQPTKNYFARRALGGHPELTFSPFPVPQGKHFVMEMRFTPYKNTSVKDASLTFVGRETLVRGSGSSTTTTNHVFHSFEEDLDLTSREVRAGEQVSLSTKVTVPVIAPTMAVGRNQIQWEAKVTLVCSNAPDWEHIEEIKVVPA